MNYLLALPKASAKSSGGYNVFPVGIAYVSAYLKAQGHSVFTANLEFCDGTTYECLDRLIKNHSIDVIATSGLSRDYTRVKEIIDVSRSIKPNILVVIGGGIISGDPLPAMIALGADIGVIGQGEITMQELATALDKNISYAEVSGLIFRLDDRYITTRTRDEVKDLDSLPFPDYDGFAFAEYMRQINYDHAYVIASRSCPFKCTFCFHPSGDKYRKRSLDNIFLEIDYFVNTFEIKGLIVSDELFAPNRSRVVEFCNRIAKYKLEWSVQLRVCDVDKELLQMMRACGCSTISYGIESADDRVLRSMAKKITLAQINNALQLTYESGIDIQGGLIFGDIAENSETVKNSLDWYDKHVHYGLELNMIHIFPGTGLYKKALEMGVIKDRIKFLTDGCPLINVSGLTAKEYRDLSSNLYERNMRAKYEPDVFELHEMQEGGRCLATATCNRCGSEFSSEVNALHVKRVVCITCKQRYYIDPYKKLTHKTNMFDEMFTGENLIVLWGAGEICIKLLDSYPELQKNKYVVVDSSLSRQGYSVCGKPIHPLNFIDENGVTTIIITVVARTEEIVQQIAKHTSVERVFLPTIVRLGNQSAAVMLDTAQNNSH